VRRGAEGKEGRAGKVGGIAAPCGALRTALDPQKLVKRGEVPGLENPPRHHPLAPRVALPVRATSLATSGNLAVGDTCQMAAREK
jgi:hypothetical protein